MSRVTKPAEDVAFLDRVDRSYRVGATVREIAEAEGLDSPGALHAKVTRLGFRFSRIGGLMIVDLLMGRPFADWITSGDLTPLAEEVAA